MIVRVYVRQHDYGHEATVYRYWNTELRRTVYEVEVTHNGVSVDNLGPFHSQSAAIAEADGYMSATT